MTRRGGFFVARRASEGCCIPRSSVGLRKREHDPSITHRADLAREAVESPLPASLRKRFGVHAPNLPLVPRQLDGHVVGELYERPAQFHDVAAGAQALLLLGTGDLVDVGEDAVERAEVLQQLRRRLVADASDSRHVIDGVADERLQIDDLLGRNPPIGEQLGPAELLALAEVEHTNAVGDELAAILVAGADERVDPALVGGDGEGGEDVVGLVARVAEDRDAQPRERLLDERDLEDEVFGHRRAVRLVIRVQVAAEGRLGAVEGADQVRRLQASQEEHNAEEAEHRIRRHAGGAGHALDAVEDLEDERVRIDEVERFSGGRLRHGNGNPEETEGDANRRAGVGRTRGIPHARGEGKDGGSAGGS